MESDVRYILHAWTTRSSAWNRMSGLPIGLHAWNARAHDWNLMSGIPMMDYMHGMPGVKPGI